MYQKMLQNKEQNVPCIPSFDPNMDPTIISDSPTKAITQPTSGIYYELIMVIAAIFYLAVVTFQPYSFCVVFASFYIIPFNYLSITMLNNHSSSTFIIDERNP